MTDTTIAAASEAPEAAEPVAVTQSPATEAAPAKPSLSDRIYQVMEAAEAPPDKGKAAPPDGDKTTESDGRPRDDRGRFALKDNAPEASVPGATEGAQPAVTTPAPGPAVVQQPEAHPKWDGALKAKFTNLPAEAKQFALDVQAVQEAYNTRRDQEFASYRQAADPLLSAVQPFQSYLAQVSAQMGVPPGGLISGLLDTERVLRTGNQEQKVQALGQVMQSYGIDLAQIIGGQIAQNPGQPGAQQFDPAILNLRQTNVRLENEVNSIKAALAQQAQFAQQAEDQKVKSTIDAFLTEKNADGTVKHPHVEWATPLMSHYLSSGRATTLSDAYELALAPMQQSVATELANRHKATDAERQAAVEKARKAAPVKAATGSLPNGKAAVRGLRAHVSDAIDKSGLF